MGGIATTLRSPPGSSFRAGVLTSAALLGRYSSLRSAFEPVQFPPSLDKKARPPFGVAFLFLEMGGIAFQSPTSCRLLSGRLRRYSAFPGRIYAPTVQFLEASLWNTPLKSKKPPDWVVFCFLEMGGIALRSGPPALSLQAALDGLRRPPWRLIFAFAQRHLTINSPHLSIKKQGHPLGWPCFFWRWGELNPRPEV